MALIKIGKVSKYHIYILVSIICQFISDYLMGLNPCFIHRIYENNKYIKSSLKILIIKKKNG